LLVTLSDNSSGKSSTSSTTPMNGSSIHNLAPLAGSSNTIGAAAAAAAAAPPDAVAGAGGPANSVFGDLLCLISACFYASYTIVLRKSLPDEEDANVALFFGYVGLLCSVVFAPVVAVLAGWGALHLKIIPAQAYLIIFVEGKAGKSRRCNLLCCFCAARGGAVLPQGAAAMLLSPQGDGG
jgi:drug/metabolite transporter (DMT)-like permease